MIIFAGVAGSGKSVQGRMLADEMAVPWLSTGEFLRMMIAGERRRAMLSGKLLEDSEIIEMVQKIFALTNTRDEFILDGFPRTVGQADWLLNQAKHGQLGITAVIHLTASEETVEERLLERGRQDDTREAIRERFNEFEQSIKPILEEFRRAGVRVCDIDAAQSIQEVHDDVVAALGVR